MLRSVCNIKTQKVGQVRVIGRELLVGQWLCSTRNVNALLSALDIAANYWSTGKLHDIEREASQSWLRVDEGGKFLDNACFDSFLFFWTSDVLSNEGLVSKFYIT